MTGDRAARADIASPPPADLLSALFANQQLWLHRLATGLTSPPPDHSRVWRQDGVTAARTGTSGVLCLGAAPGAPERDIAALEAALAWLRAARCGDVLVWAPSPRPELDLPLLARGLEPSFAPHWMTRPIAERMADPAPRAGVEVHLAGAPDLVTLGESHDIPYVSTDQLPQLEALIHAPTRERRVWLLVARRRRPFPPTELLGQAIVHLSDGPGGPFAGLYNIGVHRAHRRQGIGAALTTAACNLAYSLGALHIGLNATPAGEPLYAQLGFRHLADGQTWLLPGRRLLSPPDPAVVHVAEAIGDGTMERAGELPIPTTLANGETPLAFAARFHAPGSARWLLAHGATPEIVPLWALGLRDEARALLLDPAAVNRRIPPGGTTPLHEAVRRGDVALAHHLIAAGADMDATDDVYRATPLGWAEALGRDDIAVLLRTAMGA